MNNRKRWILSLALALLVGASLASVAQSINDELAPDLSVLLVDCTKTFASTARVGALAGAIRSTDLFELTVRFSDETCMFSDPLACGAVTPDKPYDAVIIIPRGIDDGSANTVWIITTIMPWASPEKWEAIAAAKGIIDHVFADLASATDPTIDLWPAFAASLYQAQGWIR